MKKTEECLLIDLNASENNFPYSILRINFLNFSMIIFIDLEVFFR